jgi:hypothetical protein
MRLAAETNSAARKVIPSTGDRIHIDSECGEFIPPGICEALVRSFLMKSPEHAFKNYRFKEQGIQEVQMKRTDPATDLAERAIRQWQMSGSKAARHDLGKETELIPAKVREGGGISTFTVGSVAGFLGAITSLICNIAGALVLGVEPLRLLRIYATILEGRRALDISRADFFIAAFTLHIGTGILFGTIFALGAVNSAPDFNATFWLAQVMGLPSGW